MENNEKYIFGIDPGLGGAIAILKLIDNKIVDYRVHSVPKFKEKGKTKKTKNKSDYDLISLYDILKEYIGKEVVACIEKVNAMPGQGVTSMFTFGEGFGIWRGIIAGLGFKLNMITPQGWKSEWHDKLIKKLEKPEELKISVDKLNKFSASEKKKYKEMLKEYNKNLSLAKRHAKDNSRELAAELFPKLVDEFKLKKDDGKAEAILIAEKQRRLLNESI